MLTTSLLSMWLSNTATTTMMLPIATAVLSRLHGDSGKMQQNGTEKTEEPQEKELSAEETNEEAAEEREGEVQELEIEAPPHSTGNKFPYDENFAKGMLISIPYAATIGGISTLTGTPPNLVLDGQMKRSLMKKKNKEEEKRMRAVILSEYRLLGPMTCVFTVANEFQHWLELSVVIKQGYQIQYYANTWPLLIQYYANTTLILIQYYANTTLILIQYYANTTLILIQYYANTTLILIQYYANTTLILIQYASTTIILIQYYGTTNPLLCQYYTNTNPILRHDQSNITPILRHY
ncbi:hypothetical protein scyTo_0017571 [Scyliorhinus torazame]|uniref:Citrate transporter-like domain-containing protein n=1 Tax=Scyliorhinus torazame TaxID=75743 RepID=A0A401PVV2_SCYTO|nr:hypothetical protein [Scyliorhinus torazame]